MNRVGIVLRPLPDSWNARDGRDLNTGLDNRVKSDVGVGLDLIGSPLPAPCGGPDHGVATQRRDGRALRSG